MQLNRTQIETVQRYFSTKPVLKAYLFGSYVRDEADAKSDVDFLVDLDYSKRIGLEFVQMQLDLESMLQTRVDLVSSNGLSQHIKAFIEREKQLIYEKQPR